MKKCFAFCLCTILFTVGCTPVRDVGVHIRTDSSVKTDTDALMDGIFAFLTDRREEIQAEGVYRFFDEENAVLLLDTLSPLCPKDISVTLSVARGGLLLPSGGRRICPMITLTVGDGNGKDKTGKMSLWLGTSDSEGYETVIYRSFFYEFYQNMEESNEKKETQTSDEHYGMRAVGGYGRVDRSVSVYRLVPLR